MLRVGGEFSSIDWYSPPISKKQPIVFQENFMKQKAKNGNQKQMKSQPSTTDGLNSQKQKAETKEVVGRHKNDGQKDHKGAR